MTEPGNPNVQIHRGDISVQMSELEDFGSEIHFRSDTPPPYLQSSPTRLDNKKADDQPWVPQAGSPLSPGMAGMPQMPVFLPAQMIVNSMKQQEVPPEEIRHYLQQQAAVLEALKAQYTLPKPSGSDIEQLRAELNQVKGEKMQLEFLVRQTNVTTATRLQQLEQVNLQLNDELHRLRSSTHPEELEILRNRERELSQLLMSKSEAIVRLERERSELKSEMSYYKSRLEDLEREGIDAHHRNDQNLKSNDAKLVAEISALREQLSEVQHDNVSTRQSKLYSENRRLKLKADWLSQNYEEQKQAEAKEATFQQQTRDSLNTSVEMRRSLEKERQKPSGGYERDDNAEPVAKLPIRTVANYSTNVSQVLKWETSSPEPDRHQAAPVTFPSLQYLASNQGVIENLEVKLVALNQEKQRLDSEYDRLEEQPRSQATMRRKEELELEISIASTNINNIKAKLRKFQVLK